MGLFLGRRYPTPNHDSTKKQRGDYNLRRKKGIVEPIGSMYGIHANIWGMLMVNDTMIMAYIGCYG